MLRSWPEERQIEHLRDLNFPTLWSISMHEVFPGHFLHFQHLRKVESKVRRSTLLAPLSYVEGWAHYGEQMMIEAGFGRRDPRCSSASWPRRWCGWRGSSSASSFTPTTGRWNRASASSRTRPTWRKSHARREAERGTFNPGYVVYSAGKLMLLKLRDDWQEQQGGKPSLRAFHDALLAHGSAPFWALRRLMLKARADEVLE